MKSNTSRRLVGGLLATTISVFPGCGETNVVHLETQQFGARTFENFEDASIEGPYIEIGQTVMVECVATDPDETITSARGKWYLISEPEELKGLWVAANTFENGSTEGPLESQPAVDPLVPDC